MAFGQTSGPPATGKQLQQLTDLVLAAGHTDFRDARGPLGLTQRQAAGKFTRDEADALIARLEAGDDAPAAGAAEPGPVDARPVVAIAPAAKTRPARRAATAPTTAAERSDPLRNVASSVLAAELQRRGWVVMEP